MVCSMEKEFIVTKGLTRRNFLRLAAAAALGPFFRERTSKTSAQEFACRVGDKVRNDPPRATPFYLEYSYGQMTNRRQSDLNGEATVLEIYDDGDEVILKIMTKDNQIGYVEANAVVSVDDNANCELPATDGVDSEFNENEVRGKKEIPVSSADNKEVITLLNDINGLHELEFELSDVPRDGVLVMHFNNGTDDLYKIELNLGTGVIDFYEHLTQINRMMSVGGSIKVDISNFENLRVIFQEDGGRNDLQTTLHLNDRAVSISRIERENWSNISKIGLSLENNNNSRGLLTISEITYSSE
jgi:hypothetical protein